MMVVVVVLLSGSLVVLGTFASRLSSFSMDGGRPPTGITTENAGARIFPNTDDGWTGKSE